jgi:uncharacterized protein YbcV (DUF1398 family)
MPDLNEIVAIQKRAAAEGWPYPYLFNSLKALGIERYEVDVATHQAKFVGGGASVLQPAPEGFEPLTVAGKFDLEALKTALGRVQRKESTYSQFLAEIAAAGVPFYRVDMKPRTVTYHGPKPYKYVEKVPETT